MNQLGIHAYFEPYWHECAQKHFLHNAARYLGHTGLAPAPDTYSLSPTDFGEHLIVRDAESKLRVLQNACRHQGARLVDRGCGDKPSGKCPDGAITCPIHQWTWNTDGTLRGAPMFKLAEIEPGRRELPRIPHREWCEMIFKTPLGGDIPWVKELDAEGRFGGEQFSLRNMHPGGAAFVYEHDTSWLVFANIFCDMRHVRVGHQATLGSVFDVDGLEWRIGEHYSMQHVPMRALAHRPGREYSAWHLLTTRILDALEWGEEKRRVLWGFFYPGLTVEVFPLCTIISTIIPTGPSSFTNIVQFFFPNELVKRQELFEEYRKCQIDAYSASMREDDDFIAHIGSGLFDMHSRGEIFHGLAHPEEEKGILAFRKWLDPVEASFWSPRPR